MFCDSFCVGEQRNFHAQRDEQIVENTNQNEKIYTD